MKVIDSDNYAASGIEAFFFPGGEPHARVPKDFGDALLYLKARTWNDVGLGIMVGEALYNQSSGKVWLFVPYFPGARQDRSDGQTPITAQWMRDTFRVSFDRIFTFDVHSDVVGKMVTKNFMPWDLGIERDDLGFDEVIAPDAGAAGRAEGFMKHIFYKKMDVISSPFAFTKDPIQCEKKRNFATGKFEGFTMPPLDGPARYLIVDDICDGGGTFNLLAQEFEKEPVSKYSALFLWVSHGIFSKGVDAISPVIKKIYTTDSFYPRLNLRNGYEDPRIHVVSLQPIVDRIVKGDY